VLVIASYPRSGNHLVRYLVEYLTGRPTLGCRDNPDDIPIYQQGSPALAHVGGPAIAEKVHYLHELNRVEVVTGAILVCRDPTEALLSHVGTRKGFKFLYRRKIKQAARYYYDLIVAIDESTYPKLAISFDDLTSRDRAVTERLLDDLIGFLGSDVLPERAKSLRLNFDEMRNQARSTLERPATTSSATHHREKADAASLQIVTAVLADTRAALATV